MGAFIHATQVSRFNPLSDVIDIVYAYTPKTSPCERTSNTIGAYEARNEGEHELGQLANVELLSHEALLDITKAMLNLRYARRLETELGRSCQSICDT